MHVINFIIIVQKCGSVMRLTKFIFVTGGVLSGIGKGVTTASIAKILQFRGYHVEVMKIDPYLNVDPGTMNPIEHGEVFVTEDSWEFIPADGFSFKISEIDQDFGTYERFLNYNVHPSHNITSGQIYLAVILKERAGGYLGRTVQIIPHITDEIKSRIRQVQQQKNPDFLIIEVGGTVGDIEAMPFLEAIRQLISELEKDRTLIVHVTLVPFLESVGEFKTKPTQHSVRTLQGLGLQPDVIVCRSTKPLSQHAKSKISKFCNVSNDAVISNPDIDIIYKLPLNFEKENVAAVIERKMNIDFPKPDFSNWFDLVNLFESSKKGKTLIIALPGKYTEMKDTYVSIIEALTHSAVHSHYHIKIKWIDTEKLSKSDIHNNLKNIHGILLTPGFGSRGVEGMIQIAEYAIANKIPFLGICFGAQLATVAFARSIMGWKDAHTTEVDPSTKHPVVDLMETQRDIHLKGGTMRLGAFDVKIVKGTHLFSIYKTEFIKERFRHRYHLIEKYLSEMKSKGLIINSYDRNEKIINGIELLDHPFFIGVQFHPEFKSRPNNPHPLYSAFIKAAIEFSERQIK